MEFDFFYSEVSYETRASFLLPLVNYEQKIGSFFGVTFNFEILFL